MTKQRRHPKAKKRKGGPGRKPGGPIRSKISNFSTRITAETRQALETEARAWGQSVSQVAEQLLRLGIKRKYEMERPGATRAFCQLVAELTDLVGNFNAADGKRVNWRADPFLFEALRLAIQKLMDTIKPTGNIRPLTENYSGLLISPLAGPYDTPQARADWAVTILWHHLLSVDTEPLTADMFSVPVSIDMLTEMERSAFAMARAREALQIEFRAKAKEDLLNIFRRKRR